MCYADGEPPYPGKVFSRMGNTLGSSGIFWRFFHNTFLPKGHLCYQEKQGRKPKKQVPTIEKILVITGGDFFAYYNDSH
jgi:hypothetical protein